MSRYATILIGLILLGGLFSLSCNSTCVGDKEDDSGDVRCDGNILETASSTASSSDNEPEDAINNPDNIEHPAAVTIGGSSFSFEIQIFQTEVTNQQYASFLREKGTLAAQIQDGNTNDCHLDNDKVALCYQFTGPGQSVKNEDNEDVIGGKARITATYDVDPANENNHPVTYVSWYAAKFYCEAIGWRLPSKQEWESAARRDRGNYKYPWGVAVPTCQYANFKDEEYCSANTASVDSYSQGDAFTHENDHVQQLAGNVYEWTTEEEDDDDKDERERTRVAKGGAWDSNASDLEISTDSKFLPTVTKHNIGFRCVK